MRPLRIRCRLIPIYSNIYIYILLSVEGRAIRAGNSSCWIMKSTTDSNSGQPNPGHTCTDLRWVRAQLQGAVLAPMTAPPTDATEPATGLSLRGTAPSVSVCLSTKQQEVSSVLRFLPLRRHLCPARHQRPWVWTGMHDKGIGSQRQPEKRMVSHYLGFMLPRDCPSCSEAAPSSPDLRRREHQPPDEVPSPSPSSVSCPQIQRRMCIGFICNGRPYEQMDDQIDVWTCRRHEQMAGPEET